MNKNLLILIVAIIILVIAGLFFVMSTGKKVFAYNQGLYECEKAGTVGDQTVSVIRAVSGTRTALIVHNGKKYHCQTLVTYKKPDIVLSLNNTRVYVSNETGQATEVPGGTVVLDANGKTVVINTQGNALKIEADNGKVVEYTVKPESLFQGYKYVEEGGEGFEITPKEGGYRYEETSGEGFEITPKEGGFEYKDEEGSFQVEGLNGANIQAEDITEGKKADITVDEGGLQIEAENPYNEGSVQIDEQGIHVENPLKDKEVDISW